MIHTGFHVSRATQGLALHAHRLRIRGFHPLRPDFPVRSAHLVHGFWRPYYPTHALRHAWFGLFPVRSPLLGESLLFSLPAGTKMFQFPALASILDGWYSFRIPGCPIRRFTDQGLFAPPRDFSQLITSFIASESQGIRHAPLLTFLITSH